MKIKRIINNTEIEIELTPRELDTAYREQKRQYLIDDLKILIAQGVDIRDDDIDRIADIAENCLDDDDALWDCYWSDLEYASTR